MKKIFKISAYTLMIIFGLVALLLLGLHIVSPGQTTALVKDNGNPYMNGISIIERKDIGGVEQSMIIRSKDVDKPVLLYLHGGPGSPEFPFIQHYKTDLEEYFTVCYWEQRGAGLSYAKDITAETMTLDQFIQDTKEVSIYLLDKFNKKKLYIMGHSWGTLLASHAINRYPELYHAYFGIGQVGNQLKSEKISYEFAMSEAKLRGDKKAIKKLKEIGPPPYSSDEDWLQALSVERKYVGKYGGAIREGSFMKIALTSMINCREYRLKNKLNYMKANNESLGYLWATILKANLTEDIPTQYIPVYIFQGRYDFQTSYDVARSYYEQLEAPVKEFYTFENSAHSPNYEEKERFEELVGGILRELEEEHREKEL